MSLATVLGVKMHFFNYDVIFFLEVSKYLFLIAIRKIASVMI